MPRLFVLTSGPSPPNPGEMMASRRFETMLEEVHGSSIDYVLVDSPAFIPVGDAAAVAAKVDGLVLVVNIERTSKPELEDTREFLAPLPCRKLGVVAVSEKFTGQRLLLQTHLDPGSLRMFRHRVRAALHTSERYGVRLCRDV